MVDVFISYSRDNQEAVRRLAEAVKRLGYSVWWDDELPAHRPYGDVITEQIEGARAAIVVWSQSSAASEWVRAEADVARNQKKLIQASIDDRMPPMPFNQIQFASIGDWTGEDDHPGWRKVKASLTALCGPRGAAAAAPAPPPEPAPVPPPKPEPPPPAAPEPAPPPEPEFEPEAWTGFEPASGRGTTRIAVIMIAVSLLVIAAVALLALTRNRSAASADTQAAADWPSPAQPAPPPAAEPAPALAPEPEPAPMPPPPASAAEEFSQQAEISDPDGFTYVRGSPSSDSDSVARINVGEVFTTHQQEGDWWRVRTGSGVFGYMSRSRIRLRLAR